MLKLWDNDILTILQRSFITPIQKHIMHLWLHVGRGRGWSPDWMCIADMSTPMSRTPVPQTHGSDKAFAGWSSEKWQSLPPVQLWMLTNAWPLAKTSAYRHDQLQLPPPHDCNLRPPLQRPPAKISSPPPPPFVSHLMDVLSLRAAAACASDRTAHSIPAFSVGVVRSFPATPVRPVLKSRVLWHMQGIVMSCSVKLWADCCFHS